MDKYMTKEELFIIADAAGIGKKKSTFGASYNDLRRFAKIIAAGERERCYEIVKQGTGEPMQYEVLEICLRERSRIAQAIRARGER
jgi:hypothetical protein